MCLLLNSFMLVHMWLMILMVFINKIFKESIIINFSMKNNKHNVRCKGFIFYSKKILSVFSSMLWLQISHCINIVLY